MGMYGSKPRLAPQGCLKVYNEALKPCIMTVTNHLETQCLKTADPIRGISLSGSEYFLHKGSQRGSTVQAESTADHILGDSTL